MPVPTTNVTFSSLQTDFGGSNPINLSEYYLGGALVRNNTTAPNGPISSSGLIRVGMFRGATQGTQNPPYGTYLGQFCSGYTLYHILADGNGGSFNQLQNAYSTSCGWQTPTGTWSISVSPTSGTPGTQISSTISVSLNYPANTTATFTFNRFITSNNGSVGSSTVTISTGGTFGSSNSGTIITNGSGTLFGPETLYAQVTSQTYSLDASQKTSNQFSYRI
jgi:hypothetical protein